MKKTFKKVVAAVTTAALAFVGTVTFNPADAKAADTKTMHITVTGDLPSYDGAAFQGWGGVSVTDTVAVNTLSTGWGESNDTAVKPITLTDGKADMEYTVDTSDDGWNNWTGMQILLYTSSSISQAGGNFSEINSGYFNDIQADEVWVTFTFSADGNSYTISTIDPSAITAADVEKLIDEIGDVTLDSEGKISAAEQAVKDYLAVSDSYKTDDISNYATLTAAREKYDELKAADDKAKEEANAAAAGEITLYVEKPSDWDGVSLWAWTDAGNLFEAWPGEAMTACENNEGWYKATISANGVTNIIFNNAGSPQTKNIEGLSAGTYWYTLVLNDGEEQYDVNTVVTEAPEGWEDEEKAEIETNDPEETGDDETGDDETGDEETEDTASAWDDAKLKIHVKMPELENWDALGVYLFGSDENLGWSGSELSGAWPGTAMVLENDSETWYAFGGTFSDGYYKLIINNFVSDDEAADGAVKCQAKDLDITDGEYWITIDVDEEGNFVATVMTEAPEDYDGTGLSDDQITEEPTSDEETTDDAADDTNTDDNKGADPASGSTDGLPVAGAMVVVMVSAAVVVASRKRRAA